MPLYEYQCSGCEESFEILQRMGEGPDGLACPECGSDELAKQFSTFAAATSSPSAGKGPSPAGDCGAPACGTGFT